MDEDFRLSIIEEELTRATSDEERQRLLALLADDAYWAELERTVHHDLENLSHPAPILRRHGSNSSLKSGEWETLDTHPLGEIFEELCGPQRTSLPGVEVAQSLRETGEVLSAADEAWLQTTTFTKAKFIDFLTRRGRETSPTRKSTGRPTFGGLGRLSSTISSDKDLAELDATVAGVEALPTEAPPKGKDDPQPVTALQPFERSLSSQDGQGRVDVAVMRQKLKHAQAVQRELEKLKQEETSINERRQQQQMRSVLLEKNQSFMRSTRSREAQVVEPPSHRRSSFVGSAPGTPHMGSANGSIKFATR